MQYFRSTNWIVRCKFLLSNPTTTWCSSSILLISLVCTFGFSSRLLLSFSCLYLSCFLFSSVLFVFPQYILSSFFCISPLLSFHLLFSVSLAFSTWCHPSSILGTYRLLSPLPLALLSSSVSLTFSLQYLLSSCLL